jgi:hypothetical protein
MGAAIAGRENLELVDDTSLGRARSGDKSEAESLARIADRLG